MAVYALTSEYLAINSVDRSADIKSAVLTVDAAALDTMDMASGGWMEQIAGTKSGTLTVEFQDDAAASAIDSVLWALFGTVTTFEVRATSASVGTGNAKYTGSILVNQFAVGGAVGELATKSLTFPTSGAVTRATA